MEYLYGILSAYIKDPRYVTILFVVMVALAVFLVGLALTLLITSFNASERKRLRALSDDQIASNYSLDLDSLIEKDRMDRYLDPMSRYLTPQKSKERLAMQERLRHAGFNRKSALNRFYAIKTLLAIGLPGLVLLLVRFSPSITTAMASYYALMAGAVGVFGPNYVLESIMKKRQQVLRNSFPDMLDLLVVCIESGMGLDAALNRVADSIDMAHPELGEELTLVCSEIRMGVSRVIALRQMVNRTGLIEIKGLVAVMDQSARFGTSLADALRVYSEEFRDKRMQAAEENAAKIGTKLLFPMLVCIWPSFFVVAVGPAALKLIDAFSKM